MASTQNTERPRSYLAADAELMIGDESFIWVVSECPQCGGEHTHGGGPLEGDPRTYLGHRVRHCTTDLEKHWGPLETNAAELLNLSLSGYILTDSEPRRTAELMDWLSDEDAECEGIRLRGVAA